MANEIESDIDELQQEIDEDAEHEIMLEGTMLAVMQGKGLTEEQIDFLEDIGISTIGCKRCK